MDETSIDAMFDRWEQRLTRQLSVYFMAQGLTTAAIIIIGVLVLRR